MQASTLVDRPRRHSAAKVGQHTVVMRNTAAASDEKSESRPAATDRLLTMLRCPACKGSLMPHDLQGLECSACRVRYPVLRGVPILLDEKRSVFRASEIAMQAKAADQSRSWRTTVRQWLPDLEVNLTGRASLQRFESRLLAISERPKVLNIGGKHAGSFSVIVASNPQVDCIEAHVAFTPRTKLIADPQFLPLADESVDAIIIDAALEHLPDPQAVVDELFRVLRRGGIVYSDTPFMVPVHGGAFDFVRFSHLAHRMLYKRFSELESGVSCGPGSALAVSAQAFLLSFVRSRAARSAVKGVCSLTLFWLKYFDHFLVNRPGALDAALGTFFMGQKNGQSLSDRDLLRQYRGSSPHLYAAPLPSEPRE